MYFAVFWIRKIQISVVWVRERYAVLNAGITAIEGAIYSFERRKRKYLQSETYHQVFVKPSSEPAV